MWAQSLGWEDPLEKGMTTYSSILAWRILWTEGHPGYSSQGCKELDRTEANLHSCKHIHCNCICMHMYMYILLR